MAPGQLARQITATRVKTLVAPARDGRAQFDDGDVALPDLVLAGKPGAESLRKEESAEEGWIATGQLPEERRARKFQGHCGQLAEFNCWLNVDVELTFQNRSPEKIRR
jgi:hypothetical protein